MAKNMDTKALNYRVIIEPDVYSGSGKPCYLAYASALDVADNGDTIEEALVHITEAIRCRIEALIADGEPAAISQEMGWSLIHKGAHFHLTSPDIGQGIFH